MANRANVARAVWEFATSWRLPGPERKTKRQGTRPTQLKIESELKLRPPVAAQLVTPWPHHEIIALYAQDLPMGIQVNPDFWQKKRAQAVQARWRESPERQALDWWDKFFAYCAQSLFLTGQTSCERGPFIVNLVWLGKQENFAKVNASNDHPQESQRQAA